MTQHIIFDLDGTLCDTAKALAIAADEASQRFGVPGLTRDSIIAAMGYPSPQYYYMVYPTLEREQAAQLGRIIEQRKEEIIAELGPAALFDGVADMLRELDRQGIKLYVASTGDETHVVPTLKCTGIYELFAGVMCQQPEKQGMIRTLMAGKKRAEWLMVGDMQLDSQAARQCGIHSVGAAFGYCTGERRIGFTHIAEKPEDIISLVRPKETDTRVPYAEEPLPVVLDEETRERIIEHTQPYIELMMKYNCALREVRTKFEVLSDEFSVRHGRNPMESISTRVKKPMSLMDKLRRKGLEPTIENIRRNIFDVAGARVICSFPEDTYALAEMLARQDDITVVKIKDYIAHPKENGYRSLHMIVEVPIFLSSVTEHVCVEVQLRTIAMDFWASLEHKLKYKKQLEDAEQLSRQLKECADDIAALDLRMQQISRSIERQG